MAFTFAHNVEGGAERETKMVCLQFNLCAKEAGE